ncbi:LuxR family transcriptional regulator [Lacrimispora amygdalina]|uniref:LuxR family transcriptional regulator n=1 Tax=Lacrimispora amygdalina TaxID=253257 RepID=A0A3E2N5B1_9FIRM|nr:helix-turn-helix transcriptional regulator [Clostridium indicum]RFZ76081.1 LuxR family transcriptional regulator [Clostridium indicum]
MAKGIIFLYNLFIIIVYSGIMWMSFFLFMNGKDKILLWIGIIYSAIMIDDIVNFASELFQNFAEQYNRIFMIVPTHKTLIYLILSLGYLIIFKRLINKKITWYDYSILAFYVTFMFFVPVLDNSAWKIWLYYLPSQLYNAYVGAEVLWTIKKNPENYQNSFYCWCKRLFCFTVFMNLCIIAEDTIVIFHFDVYSKYYINMNNRSYTSDILYLTHALFSGAYLMYYLKTSLRNNTIVNDINSHTHSNLPSDIEESILYRFSEAYHLTVREREILKVLLLDKTNQEISDDLFISLGTAKTHVHNIFQKIGVVKRPQLLNIYEVYRKEQLNAKPENEIPSP